MNSGLFFIRRLASCAARSTLSNCRSTSSAMFCWACRISAGLKSRSTSLKPYWLALDLLSWVRSPTAMLTRVLLIFEEFMNTFHIFFSHCAVSAILPNFDASMIDRIVVTRCFWKLWKEECFLSSSILYSWDSSFFYSWLVNSISYIQMWASSETSPFRFKFRSQTFRNWATYRSSSMKSQWVTLSSSLSTGLLSSPSIFSDFELLLNQKLSRSFRCEVCILSCHLTHGCSIVWLFGMKVFETKYYFSRVPQPLINKFRIRKLYYQKVKIAGAEQIWLILYFYQQNTSASWNRASKYMTFQPKTEITSKESKSSMISIENKSRQGASSLLLASSIIGVSELGSRDGVECNFAYLAGVSFGDPRIAALAPARAPRVLNLPPLAPLVAHQQGSVVQLVLLVAAVEYPLAIEGQFVAGYAHRNGLLLNPVPEIFAVTPPDRLEGLDRELGDALAHFAAGNLLVGQQAIGVVGISVGGVDAWVHHLSIGAFQEAAVAPEHQTVLGAVDHVLH